MASNDVTVQKEKRNVITWTTDYPPELPKRQAAWARALRRTERWQTGCSLWPLVYSTTTSRTILLIRKVRVPTGTLCESDARRIRPDLIWSVVFIRDFEDGRLSWCRRRRRRRRRRRVRSADLTKGDGPWDVLVASCPPSMSAIRCEAERRSQAGPCSTILGARLRPSRSARSRRRRLFWAGMRRLANVNVVDLRPH
jgi:hypothetical protein